MVQLLLLHVLYRVVPELLWRLTLLSFSQDRDLGLWGGTSSGSWVGGCSCGFGLALLTGSFLRPLICGAFLISIWGMGISCGFSSWFRSVQYLPCEYLRFPHAWQLTCSRTLVVVGISDILFEFDLVFGLGSTSSTAETSGSSGCYHARSTPLALVRWVVWLPPPRRVYIYDLYCAHHINILDTFFLYELFKTL